MTLITILLSGLAAAGVGGLLWSAIVGVTEEKKAIRRNLMRGAALVTHVDATTKADKKRVNAAGAQSALILRRLVPAFEIRMANRLLEGVGMPVALPLSRLLAVKAMLTVVGILLSVALIGSMSGPMGWLFALFTVALLHFTPDILLYGRGQERRQTIDREVPDILDQMTIAVDAGLGFDAAMMRVANNSDGPLAKELLRTMYEMNVGLPRQAAYANLLRRTPAEDLKRFIGAISKAEKYGLQLSGVLREQAKEMRLKRRMRAEEAAMKIPTKVVMPLMLCILPVMFIVILGPLAVTVTQSLR